MKTYRVGLRSRGGGGTWDHLVARLRHSPEAPSLHPGSPGHGRTVRDFLTLWKPEDRSEMPRLYDPGPFFEESMEWFRQAIRNG